MSINYISKEARVSIESTVDYGVRVLERTQTDISSLDSFYIDMGARRVSLKKCLVQYPLFFKAYFDDSVLGKEFFKLKIFYIREANKL